MSGASHTPDMPYIPVAETEWEQEMLVWFGRVLRRARLTAGLGQRGLAERCGVSQSTISRLERGGVARLPLVRLLSLSFVLGGGLPVGACPHGHDCPWPQHRPARPMLPTMEVAILLAQRDVELAGASDDQTGRGRVGARRPLRRIDRL